jgi:ATP-binding cassette subfamily B protein
MACDRICVLDHGKIVEQGDHRELMQLDGLYATMSKQQLQPDAPVLTQAA